MEGGWPPLKRGVEARDCNTARECLEACRAHSGPVVARTHDPEILDALGESTPPNCVILVTPACNAKRRGGAGPGPRGDPLSRDPGG
ncbi:hypothetical protein [Stetteria hydrogenophila]